MFFAGPIRFTRLLFCPLWLWALVAVVPARAQNELPRDMAKLYAQFCASCHGEKLDGGLGGSLIDGAWKHGDGGDEHLARVITDGIPALGMPGFGAMLDPARVRGLSVFIHEKETRAREAGASYAKPADGVLVKSRAATFRLETLVTGLGIPWSITFLPGTSDVLVAEKSGRLRVVREGRLLPDAVAGTPKVFAEGQGGLMVVQAHPDYAAPGNGWIYLAFSDPGQRAGEAMTAIVRGRIRDGRWIDEQQIYRAPAGLYKRGGVHFGTRLVFDKGYLFFAIGERGAKENAQDLARPNGKIHRVFDDGRVPDDNPFVKTPGALPTIWSYGHRNPQGLAARPGTTGDTLQIWETEHGPRGGDELNIIQRGANFGWPLVTWGIDYNGTPISAETSRAGLADSVVHWTPSIAVCGLDFYAGDRFPAWKGNLFVGALAQQELRRVVLDGDTVKEQEVLFRGIGRVRSVHAGPDGLVYVCLEGPGRIVRLVPAE
jgi:glucose/arabinose dehydrogenase